jgi:U32 family peptidase
MPAGGFDSGIAAIEGGADALYLGFSEFSARKQARNFDRLEYRRIHRLAGEKCVKLYVTLNTILLDPELDDAAALLAFLGRFPPDAILVQDWGLASLIRERHPGIALHASTQAAIQGIEAVRIAKELGASRIVLPRETSLAEMRSLAEAAPEVEFEAFVHGALCYSFSGLCLASGLVLGRSGNRGECAQLCRSYYDVQGRDGQESGGARPGGRGYWFSCRDLELGERVAELASAGIRSLKVEGRMKGPEYCYAVARYYRAILDGMQGMGPGETETERRRIAARTAFSRSPTEAWLFERGGSSLIDSEYPGHRGVSAGKLSSAAGARIVVELRSDLGLRDGLLVFEDGDPSRPLRFSVNGLRDPRSGRELFMARSGSSVEMDAPVVEGRTPRLMVGQELFRISAREMDRREMSPEEYEAEREELGLRLQLDGGRIGAELELPDFPRARGGASGRYRAIEPGGELPFDRARTAGGFARALAVFSESGEADFRLAPVIDAGHAVELPSRDGSDRSSCAVSELFLPPSILKREKNRIYARAAELVAEAELAYARESTALRDNCLGASLASDEGRAAIEAPPRAALVFPRPELPTGMPFATRRDLLEERALPSWGGRLWLPLAPLVLDREEYGRLVRGRLRKEQGEGKPVIVGLGALHHIALARELVERKSEGLGFFLDFSLYVANELAFSRLSSLLPKVEFTYRYIEAECMASGEIGAEEAASGNAGAVDKRIVPIGSGFEPPLFQSLGCAIKHRAGGGSCPDECARAWSTALRDRDRRYRLLVEDCVTMLFRAGAPSEGAT